MSQTRKLLSGAVLVMVALSGCTTARFVQSGPDGGTVAIPSNSNSWPFYHREKAEKMMAQRCPAGYEIVKEEEAVIGQTTSTSESVDRTQFDPKTGKYGSKTREVTTTSGKTTTMNETEWRITFRAKQASTPAAQGFQTPPVVQTSGALPSRPVPVQ